MGDWTLDNMGSVRRFREPETWEVTFEIRAPHLSGTARYEVNASDEESAVRIARRRAVADHLPVATARSEARRTGGDA